MPPDKSQDDIEVQVLEEHQPTVETHVGLEYLS